LLEMSRLLGRAKKTVLSKACELRRTVVRIVRLRLSRMTYEVTEWTVPRIGTIGGEPGRSAVSSWRPSRQASVGVGSCAATSMGRLGAYIMYCARRGHFGAVPSELFNWN